MYKILVRGGGDLASGVIARVYRAGWQVLVTELPKPLSVRRTVSFSQAVYSGEISIEGIVGQYARDFDECQVVFHKKHVAVMVDPSAACIANYQPDIIIDGRMLKHQSHQSFMSADLFIGLGPGFTAGQDCHAVIETKRGPKLGRVIWRGTADPDSGIPESVNNYRVERVIRAPCDGTVHLHQDIGKIVNAGDVIALVGSMPVVAQFRGVLRGLIQDEIEAYTGMKIGDLDPRCDLELCSLISDKALAVGGGVLEAILTFNHKGGFYHER